MQLTNEPGLSLYSNSTHHWTILCKAMSLTIDLRRPDAVHVFFTKTGRVWWDVPDNFPTEVTAVVVAFWVHACDYC